MGNKILHIIYPKDDTTDFLDAIPNYIQDIPQFSTKLYRIESVNEHMNFLNDAEKLLPVNEPVMFMGHGMSTALSGASVGGNSFGPFISENELAIFKKRKIILLSCRSNEYLQKYGFECGVNAGIGFPNMITDPYELLYPEEPDRVSGVAEKDIESFKQLIVDSVKYSLHDFINNDFSFYQLYKRIKLRAQKALLDYYSSHTKQGMLPLGKMLYDFNDGINFIGK